MKRLILCTFWVLLALFSPLSAQGIESDWPRTVPLHKGMVTIYSLQVDEMSNDTIRFRAALAYRATAGDEPVFGAGWFESRVEIDSSKRIVHPVDLKVTDTRFPAGIDDLQSELSTVLAQQSSAWNLDFSLDELESALKTAEAESEAARKLNTAPPRIIYRDHPALLVSIDGEPIIREIENSPYQAVINTPYPMIFDGDHYFLNAAKDVWYRASQATGPYRFETSPPADIAAMVNDKEAETDDGQAFEKISAANAPEIVVSTEPAELIVTEGPAAFVPLVDDLLVLQNSDDDVFMHVSSQKFYIVLAGRWYHASSLNGPWSYRQADDLPKAFANIPRDSNQADSRVYVAGTEEARDAVLDAEVPQTAAVKRGEVDIAVVYDGEPVYQPVDGTNLVYIENTGSTVLQSEGLYYLVENGVWYVSSSPNGPWQVSDHRPVQVETILPTSPVYNVKYVRVYDSTPSVVYVGYTPGYTGSYVYHNTVFYGSGWYHRPWVSPYYYYPRYSTWGFHANYDPWSGWNFGLSWGWGPFSVSYYTGGYWHHNHYWHHRHYGRWGPGRYRYGHHGNRHGRDRYAHNNRGRYDSRGNSYGGRRGSDRNANRSRGDSGRYAQSERRSDSGRRNDNLYRDSSQRARVADTRDRQPRTADRAYSDTSQVSYSGKNGRRQQNYTGLKKGERNRIQPVTTSELRLKADVRDVNFEANRGRMLADNSGNVYHAVDRDQVKSKTDVQRKKRSTNGNSSRRSQVGVSNDRNRKSSIRASNTAVRQSQQRDSTSRSSQKEKAPARQSKPKTGGNNTRQRSSQGHSNPTPEQNSSRSGSQAQDSPGSGRNNSAPARKSPEKNTRKSNRQQKGSKSDGKQTGSRRSRDR